MPVEVKVPDYVLHELLKLAYYMVDNDLVTEDYKEHLQPILTTYWG